MMDQAASSAFMIYAMAVSAQQIIRLKAVLHFFLCVGKCSNINGSVTTLKANCDTNILTTNPQGLRAMIHCRTELTTAQRPPPPPPVRIRHHAVPMDATALKGASVWLLFKVRQQHTLQLGCKEALRLAVRMRVCGGWHCCWYCWCAPRWVTVPGVPTRNYELIWIAILCIHRSDT